MKLDDWDWNSNTKSASDFSQLKLTPQRISVSKFILNLHHHIRDQWQQLHPRSTMVSQSYSEWRGQCESDQGPRSCMQWWNGNPGPIRVLSRLPRYVHIYAHNFCICTQIYISYIVYIFAGCVLTGLHHCSTFTSSFTFFALFFGLASAPSRFLFCPWLVFQI